MQNDVMTERYLAACRAPGSDLIELVAHSPRLQNLFVERGQHIFERPLFVSRDRFMSFADDAQVVFELLTSLADRLFDGDMERFGKALHIRPREVSLMRHPGNTLVPMYGRCDMYDDGERFHLLEFNIGSELDGVERAGEVPKAFLDAEAFRWFAAPWNLEYVDTVSRVADTLRDAAVASGKFREPVAALIDTPRSLAYHGPRWNALRELMRERGLDLLIGDIASLRHTAGRLTLDGTALDVVLRCFSVKEIASIWQGTELVKPLMQAFEEGSIAMCTPMASSFPANKGCLAMLHDVEHRSAFSPAEKEVIDRTVPLTMSLGGADPAKAAELLQICVERQNELVLKKNDSYGGRDVVPGWSSEADAWASTIRRAMGKGYVVQRRVYPRPEILYGKEGHQSQWNAAWGMYFTPKGYAGSYARLLPAGTSVINLAASAEAMTAGVFTY